MTAADRERERNRLRMRAKRAEDPVDCKQVRCLATHPLDRPRPAR